MKSSLIGFPAHVLKPKHKVLSLFTAAFGGRQDIEYINKSGVTTCLMVDCNAEALNRMNYPGYQKICGDCFEIITKIYQSGEKFDVVTSDHWSGQDKDIHERYFTMLSHIAPILILGICQTYIRTLPSLPPGIYYKRSENYGGVYWRLITRSW